MNVKKMLRNSVFVAFSALAGCSSMNDMFHGNAAEGTLRSSSDIPAAQGKLAIKKSDGGNQNVTVTVQHMAPASRVKEGASTYVVWMKPYGGRGPINVGVLSIKKDLKGSLEFKTPFQQFDVFVTAEDSAITQSPSQHKLLTAAVDLQNRAIR